jgi:hypothetical protein
LSIPTVKIDTDKECSNCGEKGATDSGLCLKCIAARIGRKTVSEINCNLLNIRGVKVVSKVVFVKDEDPMVVTQVSFQYEGEPSEVENILMAEAQGVKVSARLYSQQGMLDFEKEEDN